MRTLEEMQQDVNCINSNLTTLESIANLSRDYSPIDIRTYNYMAEATRHRIEELEQALCEAYEAVGNYAKELGTEVELSKVSRNYALEQLMTARLINKALDELRNHLDSQVDKYNACLEKAEKHS